MPHCQALASSLDKSLLGDFATKLQQYGKLYKVKILTFWGSKKSSTFAAKKEFDDNRDNYLLTTIETMFRGNRTAKQIVRLKGDKNTPAATRVI